MVNRTPTGKLVGTTEIAQLLGTSRQRASQLTKEPGFPAPLDVLAAGAIWDRRQVERYLAKRPPDRRRREARVLEGRSKSPR
jgi:hypothetical protein